MIGILTLNGTVKLWPETFISLRLGSCWVELVYSDGVAFIEGLHLQHLVRELLHGRIEEVAEGWSLKQFGCEVERIRFGHGRKSLRHPLPFPDSCPVPPGWLCVEGIRCADYHPEASLQLVALQRDGFVLGFAQDTYEGGAKNAGGILADFGEDVHHITAWPKGRFLPWPESSRLHVVDLEAVRHRPDSWDGLEAIKDLRGEAERQRFMQRLDHAVARVVER